MTLDEIIESWSNDTKIDETELSRESIRIPLLHGKYLKEFSSQRLKLRALKLKHKKLTQTLMDYYKGDLNNPEDLKQIGREPWPKKILKQDVNYYIEGDKEMIDLNIRISHQEEIVEVLGEIIKSINNRGFVIKNAIDFLKFSNGGY